MRTKEEVQAEIDWREKEIESISTEIKNKTYKEQDLRYMEQRLVSLSFAVSWCKWFLNEKIK